MMKHHSSPLVLLSVLASFALTPIATGEDTITLEPRLKVGDVLTLILKKSVGEVRDGKPIVTEPAVSTMELTVLSLKEGEIVTRWKVKDIKLPAGAQSDHPIVKGLAKVALELVMDVRYDCRARKTSLENYDQIKDKVEEVLDVTVKLYAEEKKWDADRLATVRKAIKAFATQEAIESLMLTEPKAFMTTFGSTFSKSQEVEQAIEATVPPAIFNVPATLRWSPVRVDGESVTVSGKQEIDPRRLRQRQLEYFKDRAAKLGLPPPNEDSFPILKIEKSIEAKLDLSRGIPAYVKQMELRTTDGAGDYNTLEFDVK